MKFDWARPSLSPRNSRFEWFKAWVSPLVVLIYNIFQFKHDSSLGLSEISWHSSLSGSTFGVFTFILLSEVLISISVIGHVKYWVKMVLAGTLFRSGCSLGFSVGWIFLLIVWRFDVCHFPFKSHKKTKSVSVKSSWSILSLPIRTPNHKHNSLPCSTR